MNAYSLPCGLTAGLTVAAPDGGCLETLLPTYRLVRGLHRGRRLRACIERWHCGEHEGVRAFVQVRILLSDIVPAISNSRLYLLKM
jgi:hypothetical protein